MRILHLIHSEGVYGAERILVYLAQEQLALGDEPIIGSMRDPGTPPTEFERFAAGNGIEVVHLRISPRPTPASIGRILELLRSRSIDLVHSHGYKADILLGFLPRSSRRPMITTLHGWTNSPNWNRLRLYELLDRQAIKHLDAVAVVARSMLTLPAIKALSSGRARVVENGIPDLTARLKQLASLGIGDPPPELLEFIASAPTAVAIGRLVPEKGFTLLVDAFAQARKREGALQQLVILGDGPERTVLERRIAALGMSGRIKLPGYVEGPDRLLKGAAAFVMSSLTEGMPLVLLEALQWDTAIVATAVGAIPEILGGGALGRLVEAGKVEALVEGLLGLDSLGRLPSKGAESLGVHRSVLMAHEYRAVYESVL